MKKIIRNKYIIASLAFMTLGLSSCNDYLDKLPDNRMTIDNADKAQKLLVAAYPNVYPAFLNEMYSDNADGYSVTGWTPFDQFQTQAWNWNDISDDSDDDSPQNVWNSYYISMSAANESLQYAFTDSANCSQIIGEALLCRAYSAFMLSTIFCNAYDKTTADSELGIPYPERPQEVFDETYSRGTLAETYAKIEKDLEEGIKLVGSTYSQPKFHFTKNAAYAFATRFYLFSQQYDKAISYASKVLGSDPAAVLRDWTAWNKLSPNGQVQPNAYIASNNVCNLLQCTVLSQWGATGQNYSLGCAYAHGSYLASTETIQAAGPWGASATKFGYSVFSNSALSKVCLRKIPYSFEYTDIQAGIGNMHSEFVVFNTDELLVERAEAYALSGNYAAALKDLNTGIKKFSGKSAELTLAQIQNFYNGIAYYTPKDPTPKKAFHTSFTIEKTTQEPLLQAILQFKRILTVHEGYRMQDVKRYGITIYRRVLDANDDVVAVTDSMTVKDPRRAIQLPLDAIIGGMQANPRVK